MIIGQDIAILGDYEAGAGYGICGELPPDICCGYRGGDTDDRIDRCGVDLRGGQDFARIACVDIGGVYQRT